MVEKLAENEYSGMSRVTLVTKTHLRNLCTRGSSKGDGGRGPGQAATRLVEAWEIFPGIACLISPLFRCNVCDRDQTLGPGVRITKKKEEYYVQVRSPLEGRCLLLQSQVQHQGPQVRAANSVTNRLRVES